MHYTESGSVADKYAAGAVMGLAVRLTDVGIDRFGICQAAGCQGVFIDTSTSNTRRYCSERCMNRANVSAFRARKRGEDDGEAKAPTRHGVARGVPEFRTAHYPGIWLCDSHHIPIAKRNVELFVQTSASDVR